MHKAAVEPEKWIPAFAGNDGQGAVNVAFLKKWFELTINVAERKPLGSAIPNAPLQILKRI